MPVSHSLSKTCDITIEGLLYFLLIFAPLAYASVQILPLTIIESVIFLIFSIWLLKLLFVSQPPLRLSFGIPALAFISLVFFQLFIFPRFVVLLLSPQCVMLLDKFLPAGIAKPLFIPLSIYQNQTIMKFVELLAYAAIFIVLVNTIEKKSQIKRILRVIIFTGLLVAILEIAHNFQFPFVNRNHFAGNMEMVIPLLIGYVLSGLEKPKKIFFTFLAMVMVVALFLSLSRAGILCFLSAMVFMILSLRLRKTLRPKIVSIYILILIAVIFVLIMGIGPLFARFALLSKQASVGRFYIWGDTLRIIRDFPIFGTGLGTFRNIYPVYKTLPVQAPVFYAHNDFLQLISETGFLGAGLVIWLLFVFFKGVYSAWFSRHGSFLKAVALGGMTGALAIFFHSFFDFNLQIPANAFLFVVIMAMSYKCVNIKEGDESGDVEKVINP